MRPRGRPSLSCRSWSTPTRCSCAREACSRRHPLPAPVVLVPGPRGSAATGEPCDPVAPVPRADGRSHGIPAARPRRPVPPRHRARARPRTEAREPRRDAGVGRPIHGPRRPGTDRALDRRGGVQPHRLLAASAAARADGARPARGRGLCGSRRPRPSGTPAVAARYLVRSGSALSDALATVGASQVAQLLATAAIVTGLGAVGEGGAPAPLVRHQPAHRRDSSRRSRRRRVGHRAVQPSGAPDPAGRPAQRHGARRARSPAPERGRRRLRCLGGTAPSATFSPSPPVWPRSVDRCRSCT